MKNNFETCVRCEKKMKVAESFKTDHSIVENFECPFCGARKGRETKVVRIDQSPE